MKKLLLFTAAIAIGVSSYAQTGATVNQGTDIKSMLTNSRDAGSFTRLNGAAKGTAISDTLIPLSTAHYDSAMTAGLLYYLSGDAVYDSGFIFGMNPLGLTAFSDWWQGVYGTDTTLRILGFQSAFGGTVLPTSGASITVNVWKNDTTHVQRSTHTFFRDFPSAATYTHGTLSIPIKNLGVGAGSAPDTIKNWYFQQNVTGVADNFHLGYSMTYTWGSTNGDTIGVHSTRIGSGWGSGFYQMQGLDTVVFAQTCLKAPTGWVDAVEYGINNVNLSIVPLIEFESTVGLHGLRNNGFTFYGNYPNPAVNSTNIRFAIDRNADVNIEITDMAGRSIRKLPQGKMSAGEHTVAIDISDLATGSYIYSVTTTAGSGIACKFTVAK